MPVSDETLDRARRADRAAVEAVLAASYPSVYRMARALTASDKAASEVIDAVLRRSLRVLPTWRRGVAPENWFYHHTLLTARAARRGPPPADPRADLLVTHAVGRDADDPAYVAFVRAVRGLPRQQAEALLLHQGERLNVRLLGVAMDCSSVAAETHLRAATASLDAVAGHDAARHVAALSRAYAALGPAPSAVNAAVRGYVIPFARARRVRRVAKRIFQLVLLLAAAWALWHWRHDLSAWTSFLRNRLPTQPH